MATSRTIGERFDIFAPARLQSTVLEEIWERAFGEDYAADAKPNGFYSLSVLNRIVDATGLCQPSQYLLDIGCGYGMTSLYLAKRMGLKLYGIDVSMASIEMARVNATDRNLETQFWVADATSSGLEEGTCAIITCLDVLLYLPDKVAALKEIHRILQPAGLFMFTTWEQEGFNQRLGAQQFEDYQPLLKETGFNVEHYDIVDGAHEQQSRVLDGLIERQDDLREDIGEEAASMFGRMAKSAKEELKGRRYVFGIAQRRETI